MHFTYEETDKIGTRATLGLITLQSDETIEHDMRRMLPIEDVALYVSRVESAPDVSEETLGQMEARLPASAQLFPRPVEFDVVGYGCTSGTSVIGAEKVAELVAIGCATKAVTEPLSALIAACAALGVERLGFLSPYVAEVSDTLRGAVHRAGVQTTAFGSFNEEREERVARIAPQSIVSAAAALADAGDFDALFMSCTNLRTLDVIDEIERRIGKPVLSSNQVLAWHLAQTAGLQLAASFGALTRPRAAA
jgi:maleate isomerase